MIGLIGKFKYVFLLIGLVIGIAGAIWFIYEKGFSAGEAAQESNCQDRIDAINQSNKRALQSAQEEYDRKTKQAVETEREYWKENQKTEVRYETIEKEVVKYVETNIDNQCEFNDDFMRIWRSANANGYTTESSAGGSSPSN